ncbi:MAG: CHRD domain-containing protein, partial [Chloroflexota bacterium]
RGKSATDPDVPANTLTFSLAPGAPAGAAIDPATGLFTWTPPPAQGPADYEITIEVGDGALGDSETFTVTVNEAAVSFGEIGGVKFDDLDADGVRDAGEPGLAGWTIFLDADADGTLDVGELSTTTDGSGAYAFTGLMPGTYRVAEILQPGWERTAPEFAMVLDGASEVPANVTSAFGFAHFALDDSTRTLAFAVDFGALSGPTTGIHIHRGAPGVDGPIIYDLALAAGVASGFASPLGGTVALAEADLADLMAGNLYVNLHTTAFSGGEIRGQIVPSAAHVVVLASGAAVSDRDFGCVYPGEIRGTAFDDADGDGALDPGEPGIAGSTVFLDADGDGALDPGEATTTTDGTGAYTFTGLLPGTYRVVEVLAAGRARTAPDFAMTLDGASEVPANVTSAFGFAHFSLDEAPGALTFAVDFGDLMGSTTGIHIHAGAPGVDGPIIHDLAAAAGVAPGFASPLGGTVMLSTTEIADLMAGTLYVNLHTTAFSGGEIRGQIVASAGHAVVLRSGGAVDSRDFGTRDLNDAPVAMDDAYVVAEDGTLVVPVPGVLGNDSDVDGDTIQTELVALTLHGALALNLDGSFSYTPEGDFSGADSFQYRVTDGALVSDVATVTLTVTPVNDAPVAEEDAYSMDEDATLVVAGPGLLGNDRDVDGDALTTALVTGPAHGTAALNPDGSFSYTPAADFNGADAFTYRASDGAAVSTDATVALTIKPVNDAPVVDAGADLTVDEGTAFSRAGAFSDPDLGDTWTATVDYGDGSGVQALALSGLAFELSHVYADNGLYTARVTVRDDAGAVGTATLGVTVQNVAPALTALGATPAIDEGGLVTLTGSFTDAG